MCSLPNMLQASHTLLRAGDRPKCRKHLHSVKEPHIDGAWSTGGRIPVPFLEKAITARGSNYQCPALAFWITPVGKDV